jgi:hypothetical protein
VPAPGEGRGRLLLPPECDEDALIARVYPKAEIAPRYPTPDFVTIHAELARKGVTRMLVWQEYKARHPGGCQFTQSPRQVALPQPDPMVVRLHWVGGSTIPRLKDRFRTVTRRTGGPAES